MKAILILFVFFMFFVSCISLDPQQKVRVYEGDRRLSGVNVAYDLPLVWFSTNKNYYIMLINKKE